MKIVDVNVLLYAVNRDSAHHARVRKWWETSLKGQQAIGIPWVVLLGFMRLSTNPRVFPQPLTSDDALSQVEIWLSQPNVRLLTDADDPWSIFRELLGDVGTGGNLTTDAYLASLAIAHAGILVSCDTDFSRFRKLRWENPVAIP